MAEKTKQAGIVDAAQMTPSTAPPSAHRRQSGAVACRRGEELRALAVPKRRKPAQVQCRRHWGPWAGTGDPGQALGTLGRHWGPRGALVLCVVRCQDVTVRHAGLSRCPSGK